MEFSIIQEWLKDPLASKIIVSVGVLSFLYLIRFLSHRIITKVITNVKARYFWRQTVHYILLSCALVVVVHIWADWFQSVFTLLSLIAAALTIVSKEAILNTLGYIIILSRSLFNVGDRIQVGPYRGYVIEIGPFYISLAELGPEPEDQYSGRILKVPNAVVFTQTVANSSKGSPLIWHEIKMEIKLSPAIQNHLDLINELVPSLAEPISEKDHAALRQINEEIIFLNTDPEWSFKIKEEKVLVKIRILCEAHKAGKLERKFWKKYLDSTLKDSGSFYSFDGLDRQQENEPQ